LRKRFADASSQLLEDELEAAHRGLPLGEAPEPHLVFLSEALGLEIPIARRACVALNSLTRQPRRTAWAVLIEGQSPAELESLDQRPHGSARADLVLAVTAIREWTQLPDWNWKAVER
jgi:hypothetical protein